MKNPESSAFETLCIHFGEQPERHLGAVVPPLYQNSTFAYPDCQSFATRTDSTPTRFDYTRASNPTTELLEEKIAAIERADACRAFASGMSAISAAALSCLRSGDHLITIETVYGPARRLFAEYFPRLGIETTFVRGTRIEDFRDALRPNTRLIHVESPSSLLFEIQDLRGVANLAQAHGISTICDNSCATPYFQNPAELGIDLVVHTATKYIGGHSDLIAGLVIGSSDRIERLSKMEGELLGGTVDPFASWLMLRGLRTLAVRLDRHQANALAIARFLEGDRRVRRVHYPGLSSHPQFEAAGKQMRGHSGMLSFELSVSGPDRATKVVDALQYFYIAVSWGGYESLAIPVEIEDPESGASTWIIRLSVGIENVDDLISDLDRALG
ncbi:MAG: PLP-dependent aspartate aminotransferase family protein [Planctomycetota bacterium]|nr:PLP-dependent aspartate aminotransferase family protein [Planctomycetota bacterium]